MKLILNCLFIFNLLFCSEIVFVANEGNFGASNGTISMIFNDGTIIESDPMGDVVQALEVYGDKLIVLINNSHKLKIFDITPEGIALPGIEISTNGSGPRDLVIVNEKIYFSNYSSQDIKIFSLETYSIEESIPVNGLPEDIEYDGNYLWVTIPHSDFYFSSGSNVLKIDPITNSIIEIIDVGYGPQQIAFSNGDVFVSRTFYDESWNTFHGTSKIISEDGSLEVQSIEYGAGSPCGGSVLNHQNSIYRSFNGGLAAINQDLSLSETTIGNFDQSMVYHVEKIDGKFWFGITNFIDLNKVYVLDENGSQISSYDTGLFPGDFAIWKEDYNIGDINEDALINLLDIILLVNIILFDSENEMGDINMDDFINILDIIFIVNLILNN